MITLITGVPGSGKTAFTIEQMLKFSGSDRPIFSHGIPDLKIPHHPIRCSSPNCDVCEKLPSDLEHSQQWHDWAPDGAIILIDESQNVFRPRAPSTRLPDHVAQLEVHRHRGLDFYLITQHPKLIDTNVRALVSRHVHIAGNWFRRYQLEWGECSLDTQATSNAVKSSYNLPKHVFKLYKSATIHTKLERKIPFQLYALVGLLLVAVILSYRFYQSKFAPAQKTPSSTQVEQLLKLTQDKFVPLEINRPESAPAYQHLVKITDYPRLAACISSKKKCKCYSQQGTELFITREECIDFAHTPRFNPYHVDKPDNNPKSMQVAQSPKHQQYQPDFNVLPEHEPMYIDDGIR